jgi:hypothetical protein
LTVLIFDDYEAGMSFTTISSRSLYQNPSGARKAANDGPVVITHRGRPSHVLITIEEYWKITGDNQIVVEQR